MHVKWLLRISIEILMDMRSILEQWCCILVEYVEWKVAVGDDCCVDRGLWCRRSGGRVYYGSHNTHNTVWKNNNNTDASGNSTSTNTTNNRTSHQTVTIGAIVPNIVDTDILLLIIANLTIYISVMFLSMVEYIEVNYKNTIVIRKNNTQGTSLMEELLVFSGE